MKFSEFPVVLPDINLITQEFEKQFSKFSSAGSFEEEHRIFLDITSLTKDYNAAEDVAQVRYSTDTFNKKFESDKKYFDDINPTYWGLTKKFNDLIAASEYLTQYGKVYGKNFVQNVLRGVKLFSEETKEDFRKERELTNEYAKTKAEAKIFFDGKELTPGQLRYYYTSQDRNIRKKAHDETFKMFENWMDDFNEIFDKLVKLRAGIAHKLGYKTYVGYSYDNMSKDYNPSQAGKFRDNIVKYVVPLIGKLKEKQRQRIGLDELKYYDSAFRFKTGNPEPKGDPDTILAKSVKMYSELSPETKEFIEFMTQNELLDLKSRVGKIDGGYATFFSKYKSPFIFSNMNGTPNDVEILTHEAGHAFQSYLCRDYTLYEEINSSSDVCEVHSISMEFLTYDYMNLFFEEDTGKYYYYHLDNSLRSLTSIAIADEFQELAYLRHDISIEERNNIWKSLQKKYKFELNYGDSDFVTSGCSWHMKSLIFERPFYMLEYALAQFVAFQFLFKKKEDHEKAFREYIAFCRYGGRLTFTELLDKTGLKNPFEEETVKEMAAKVEALIDSIDDSKF